MTARGTTKSIGDPLVSVVTATLNCGELLDVTRRSIELQDYRELEWIVVDGGSSDDSVAVAKRCSRLTHIVSEPDRGIYDAWNKAIDVARGDWICFLGAGDTFEQNAVFRYVDFIRNSVVNGGVQYASSKVHLTSGGTVVRTIGRPWTWNDFRRHMCTAHCGSFHHRRLFEGGARFDPSYRIAGDYEFLLRHRQSLRTAFLDEVTARMEIGGASDARGPDALKEAERAKVCHRARGRLSARVDYHVGLTKWRLRRLFWY